MVKNYKRVELKDLPFKDYVGSSKETVGEVVERKEILYQTSTKKAATYIEAGILFNEDAIFSDEYLNLNIIGKFFDSDLNGLLDSDEKEEYEKVNNSEIQCLKAEVDRLSRLEFPDSTGK